MELRLEPRAGHLLVVAAGPFDARAAKDAIAAIVKQGESSGLSRVLVDCRGITTQVSIADRFELATRLAALGHGRVRMAIVVDPSHLFTKTLEDAAHNRGVPLRTTASMREAREFLDLEDGS